MEIWLHLLYHHIKGAVYISNSFTVIFWYISKIRVTNFLIISWFSFMTELCTENLTLNLWIHRQQRPRTECSVLPLPLPKREMKCYQIQWWWSQLQTNLETPIPLAPVLISIALAIWILIHKCVPWFMQHIIAEAGTWKAAHAIAYNTWI